MLKIRQEIKYQAECDAQFPDEIRSKPGGENLDKCIQCGTCSGGCPLSIYMEYTPRKVINLTRGGFKKEVLSSNTIWLCSSCYTCTVECPKEVGITDIMYSLKQKAVQEGTYPKRFPIPVLAHKFLDMVGVHGRVSEIRLVLSLFLRTQLARLFTMRGMAIGLMKTGRFSLKAEAMERPEELQKLLDIAERKQAAR